MFTFIKTMTSNGKEKIAEKKSQLISRSLKRAVRAMNKDDVSEAASSLIIRSSELRMVLEKMGKKYPKNTEIAESVEVARLVEGLASLKMWTETKDK